MTGFFSQVPMKLLCAAVVGLAAAASLTVLFGWHGMRRALDVPRVPRPPAMYVVLGALWVALITIGSMSVVTMLLLRDHQRVDARTALADVRCDAVSPGRVRAELRTSLGVDPERYEFDGDACVVTVRQVELRPGLDLLGVRVLSRIDSVGPVQRPTRSLRGGRFVNLVARRTEAVPVTVPVDAQVHSLQVSSLSGP